MHNCPECGSLTTRKRCASCAGKDGKRRRAEGLPPLNSTHFCSDCNKQVCLGSTRCNSCERTRRWSDPTERAKMVDGIIRTHPLTANRQCVDCKKSIKPGGTRCRRCSSINFWKRPGHRERVSLKNRAVFLTSSRLHRLRKANPWFQRGAAHPKYKGNSAGRSSGQYDTWRMAVFTRDFFRCVDCNSPKDIQAHHIEHWAKNPDKRFDIANGETLCFACHSNRHGGAIGKPPTKKMKKVYRSLKAHQAVINSCPQSGQTALTF